MTLKLDNVTIRRLWLQTNGLLQEDKSALDVGAIIKKLGFVQLDTIQNVSRAHHHIIWSRHSAYREYMLDEILAARQDIFEHFTHDASVLPMEFYPMWQRRFKKFQEKFKKSSYYKPEYIRDWKDHLINRITEEGPLSTKNFDGIAKKSKKAWSRPPHKQVLDYLWYIGELSTSHREKFHKFYDLTDRVIPAELRKRHLDDRQQIDWLCHAAFQRLSVATFKEVKEFWEAKDRRDVEIWACQNQQYIKPVLWETAQGDWIESYAYHDLEERLEATKEPSKVLKIINPFDPAIRDRDRLRRLFGFDYKLEVFIPAAKRRWGYYIYPILYKDQFIGRIDVKGDRKSGMLNVNNFWLEDHVKWGVEKQKKLQAELKRFAKLANLNDVKWHIKI